ncbi:MAG: WXG100 family type VII secretion target [Clostridia bacterium]|nr:WXG100 family type VII secretion target [Clostridia bacterium]
MALVKVSTQQLTDTAGKIRAINEEMTRILGDIQTAINTCTSADWLSDAANATKEKMDTYKEPIQNYKAAVEKYATFLMDAAAHYEETEIMLEQNTSGMEFH